MIYRNTGEKTRPHSLTSFFFIRIPHFLAFFPDLLIFLLMHNSNENEDEDEGSSSGGGLWLQKPLPLQRILLENGGGGANVRNVGGSSGSVHNFSSRLSPPSPKNSSADKENQPDLGQFMQIEHNRCWKTYNYHVHK